LVYTFILFSISIIIISFRKMQKIWILFLFSLGILFFIQGNILNWNYGILDGNIINWNTYWYAEIIDIIVWLSVISLIVLKKEFIYRNIKMYIIILILIQAIPLGIKLINIEDPKDHYKSEYIIDESKKFIFSKNKNVIIFVLDAVSDSVLEKVIKENPELAKELDGFIHFNNMLGTGGYTRYSVPAFMSGKPYLNQTTYNSYFIDAFHSRGSLLKYFKDLNWNTGVYVDRILRPEIITPKLFTEIKSSSTDENTDPDLKKLSLYLAVPQSVKRYLYNKYELSHFWQSKDQSTIVNCNNDLNITAFPNSSHDLKFMNNMLCSAVTSYIKPSFKYYHLHGAHVPYMMDRHFNKKPSSYEDSVYNSLIIAIRFIHILKKLGIYDSSQIYIMSDHGSYPTTSDISKVRKQIPVYAEKTATMFMFKDFNTSGDLLVDNTSLSYYDFSSIVIDLANKEPVKNIHDFLKTYQRSKRSFYTFSNVLGDYYPKIIELEVKGDITDKNSWSMTGKTFLPVTAKKIRKFNCNYDTLSLKDRNEFIHYIDDGILDGSGLTRGRVIKFHIPLEKQCINADLLIQIKMAAVLGTNTKTGEKVRSRKFYIQADNYKSSIQDIETEEMSDFSFIYPKELVKNNMLSFKLMFKNIVPKGQFIDNKGKKGWGSSLKLEKLTLKKFLQNNKTDLQKFSNIVILKK